MILEETGTGYKFVYFPDARDTSTKDEWATRGFRVQFGEMNGHAVPKWIEYAKSRHSLESAVAYAKKITECAICKQLDANVGTLQLKDHYKAPLSTAPLFPAMSNTTIEQLQREVNELKLKLADTAPVDRSKVARNLFQDIAADYFKAQLTMPGLVQLAMIFDIPEFLDGVLPEEITEDVEDELKAQMGDFFAGDIGMFRSPEQMREYAKLHRDLAKIKRGEPVEDSTTAKRAGVRRRTVSSQPEKSRVKVIG